MPCLGISVAYPLTRNICVVVRWGANPGPGWKRPRCRPRNNSTHQLEENIEYQSLNFGTSLLIVRAVWLDVPTLYPRKM